MFGDERINLGCYRRYNENKTPLRIVMNKSVPIAPNAQGLYNSAWNIRLTSKYRNILEKLHDWFAPPLRWLATERNGKSNKMEPNV